MGRVQLQIDVPKPFRQGVKKIAVNNDKTLRDQVMDDLVTLHPELKEVRGITEPAGLSSAAGTDATQPRNEGGGE